MTTLSTDESVIIASELEGSLHLLVGEPPVSVFIVEVVFTSLQQDSQRTFFSFSDKCFIVVPATNVGKAANVTDDFAEPFGVLPCCCKRADASG